MAEKKPKRRSTADRQGAFLKAYAQTCNVRLASNVAGIERSTHYGWLESDSAYAELFKRTQRSAADYMESEAVERASKGKAEPVYYQGKRCGSIQRYSDGLMQFLLRGMMPEKYGYRTQITGPGGGPIELSIAERILAARKRVVEMRKDDDDVSAAG